MAGTVLGLGGLVLKDEQGDSVPILMEMTASN